jgi:hypothetical protein
MDGSLNDAGNAMAALVVRQFTPSRIEHQLLAQVFDLVYGQQCAAEESCSSGRIADPVHRLGDGGQAIVTHVAGRHVA